MTARPLIIAGAGGFGREVISIVRAINTVSVTWKLLGVADDKPARMALESLARSGTPYLGPIAAAIDEAGSVPAVVVAIGDPEIRKRIIGMLPSSTAYPTLIHPDSSVGHGIETGHGCVLAPGARLSIDIRLGNHVHVDQNVAIGHDTTVGGYTRLNPTVCISGEVTLGRSVYVGSNATVLQRLTVADHAVVGAGAVVVRDVPEGATVKGVPAR